MSGLLHIMNYYQTTIKLLPDRKNLAKVYNQWYNLNTQFEPVQRLNDLSGCVSHKSHCV